MGTESRDSSDINRRESHISYAESRKSRMVRRRNHIPRSTFHIRDKVYSGLGIKGVGYSSSSLFALYTLHSKQVRSGEPNIGSQWLLEVSTFGLDFNNP